MGSPRAVVAANAAVSVATMTTSALGVGTHSIGADYAGDAGNPSAAAETATLHVVRAQSRLDITGPASSELGSEVAFVVTVTGNQPTGIVNFYDGGSSLGTGIPLVGGVATLRTAALGLGNHQVSAGYSGDELNASRFSGTMAHAVVSVLATRVQLATSVNPVTSGSSVTLTATVSGSSPTGSVTLRDGVDVVATKPLAGGSASFSLASLAAGLHMFTADYSGDVSNQAASSAALFLEVSAAGSTFDSNVRAIVTSYYQTILGRAPDAAGLDYWAAEAARVAGLGADVREVFFAMAIAFFASTEYVGRNTSDAQYITDLYRTFFVRDPDAAGLSYWQGELTAVKSREAFLNSFLFSAEFSSQMTSRFGTSSVRPEVNMTIDLFRGTLGRLPDSAGFNYWLGQIRAAQCGGATAVSSKVSEVAGLFFNSGEYLNRTRSDRDFMGDVYNAYLRRGPGGDSGGFGFWVGQIATLGRDGVRGQFVPSAEFQSRVVAVVNAGCLP